jgi:hypothetical protein
MAVDANGDLVVAGYFMGTVTTSSGATLTSRGDLDGFVAKYRADGSLLWIRQVGGTGGDTLDGVRIDSGGGVIVVGRFSDTVDAGGGPLASAGGFDILVAKYTSAGAHVWSRRFGGVQSDVGTAIALDSTDNVYFTGYFSGTVDFGGGPFSVPFATDLDTYLAKLSNVGAYVWAKGFVNNANEWGTGVAVAPTDEVVLVGGFNGRIDLGSGLFQASNAYIDGYVAKFTSTGAYLWSKQFGGIKDDQARGVDVDGSGNVVVTGEIRDSVDFGGGALTGSSSYSDAFVVSYDASGAHRWSRRMGGATANDSGYGITGDASGNVSVTGDFMQTADFGSGPRTSAGSRDAFVTHYTQAGIHRWAETWGGPQDDHGSAVSAGASTVAATGSFKDIGQILDIPVTSSGSTDSFVAQRGS